jgi:hypothetical protein
MKFKGEENDVIWESFRGKTINERFHDEMDEDFDDEDDDMDEGSDDYGMMDDDPDFGEGGFDSEGDDFGDDDEPKAHGMVMEIEPVGHVEKHEVNEVLVSELKKLAEYADRLYNMRNECEFEDWMTSAITVASTYVSDVWHRLDAKADFANTGFEQSHDY